MTKATSNVWVERDAGVSRVLELRGFKLPNIDGEGSFQCRPIQICRSSGEDTIFGNSNVSLWLLLN